MLGHARWIERKGLQRVWRIGGRRRRRRVQQLQHVLRRQVLRLVHQLQRLLLGLRQVRLRELLLQMSPR
jgi:hypothetical protein